MIQTRYLTRALLGVFTAGALSVGLAAVAAAETFEVTITNLTRGQIFSPPIAAAHRGDLRIFTVGLEGAPASDALETLAEGGNPGPLADLLTYEGADVVVTSLADLPDDGRMDPVLLPGESVTLHLTSGDGNRYISVLGMLVTTNDAFFALNAARPRGGSSSYRVPAYDAGTEPNTEDCDYVPGPPCGGEGVDLMEDGEGYVHIHAGVHNLFAAGTPDVVNSREHDWRNPVAQVVVKRILE